MAIPPHLLITAPHPLLSPPSIFTLYCRPWQLPVTAMARRPHGGVDLGRWTTATFTLLGFPTSTSPDPVLAHHVRRCFCTQVPHITAEGRLRLSSVVGKKRGGRRYLSVLFHTDILLSTSPSSTHSTHGRMDKPCRWTTSCLHPRVQFPWLSASGITLSRGVGKRMDVRSTFWGGSGVSRYPGSSDEWQGTGTRTPRGRKRQKRPNHRKVPRFFPGRLAFDGRDTSLLPTPGVLNIYMTLG
ncbi:hypothetical protein BGY98DRAFT_103178 [Russula aff. rugulosa BPL654]|nr:hypothetical protein BGY98DRAFT_103178 [Russula aff. rugulosa BPL654]